MEEHNKNNKSFEELLKSMETRKTADLDDFEREALEGFALLETKDEAKQLKSELDEKIYNQLFTREESKKRPVAYWFAAAGLLLVVGLVVLFITNSENLTGKKDVAQTLSNLENSHPPKEAAAITESIPEEKHPAPNSDFKAEKMQAYKTTKGAVPADEILKNQDDESPNLKKDAADMTQTLAEETSAPKPVLADNKQKEKEEDANVKAEEKVAAPNFNQVDIAGTTAREEKKQENISFKSKKATGKKSAPASAEKYEIPTSASGNTMPESSVATKEAEGKAVSRTDDNKSTASDKDLNSNGENYCFYNGGPASLHDEVKSKLIALNITKSFEAKLFINEKKTVEKVTFIKAGELTSKEQRKITSVLKELKGFNFFIQPTQKGLHEFKFSYKP